MKVNYASNVGDPEALKTKANIYVIINESGLSKHFRKAETKQSIIDAVKNDLATNLFSIG